MEPGNRKAPLPSSDRQHESHTRPSVWAIDRQHPHCPLLKDGIPRPPVDLRGKRSTCLCSGTPFQSKNNGSSPIQRGSPKRCKRPRRRALHASKMKTPTLETTRTDSAFVPLDPVCGKPGSIWTHAYRWAITTAPWIPRNRFNKVPQMAGELGILRVESPSKGLSERSLHTTPPSSQLRIYLSSCAPRPKLGPCGLPPTSTEMHRPEVVLRSNSRVSALPGSWIWGRKSTC